MFINIEILQPMDQVDPMSETNDEETEIDEETAQVCNHASLTLPKLKMNI